MNIKWDFLFLLCIENSSLIYRSWMNRKITCNFFKNVYNSDFPFCHNKLRLPFWQNNGREKRIHVLWEMMKRERKVGCRPTFYTIFFFRILMSFLREKITSIIYGSTEKSFLKRKKIVHTIFWREKVKSEKFHVSSFGRASFFIGNHIFKYYLYFLFSSLLYPPQHQPLSFQFPLGL